MTDSATPLPTVPAHQLPATTADERWLIDGLWGYDAVGILGGEPKCCKSFCALTIALAVAGARPCLGNRAPGRTGTVLHYAAEDSLPIVRDRIERLANGLGIDDLSALPLQLITAPEVRLDRDADRRALDATVRVHQPALLILDPFVRLHRCDENVSGEVAPLLAFLRQIQRRHGCAIILVHHARKGAGGVRAGQALRGSSELHAWGDCNLFLRRRGSRLTLEAEHRAARSGDPITLELTDGATDDPSLQLHVIDNNDDQPTYGGTNHHPTDNQAPPTPTERILALFATDPGPHSRSGIQERIRIRLQTLCDGLRDLVASQQLQLQDGRYTRTPDTTP